MESGVAFRVNTMTCGRQRLPRDRTILQKKSKSESRVPGQEFHITRKVSSSCRSRIVRHARRLPLAPWSVPDDCRKREKLPGPCPVGHICEYLSPPHIPVGQTLLSANGDFNQLYCLGYVDPQERPRELQSPGGSGLADSVPSCAFRFHMLAPTRRLRLYRGRGSGNRSDVAAESAEARATAHSRHGRENRCDKHDGRAFRPVRKRHASSPARRKMTRYPQTSRKYWKVPEGKT